MLTSDYTDSTALNGTPYSYRVEAIDTDLNVSFASTEVTATPDDHGDDKNHATPVALPSTTDGQMGATDSDWFQISLVGGRNYTLSVLDQGLASAGVRLYTASGSTLLASHDGPAVGATLAQVHYQTTYSDTYYIQVIGQGGASGDYQLAVQQTDDFGNTTAEASNLVDTYAVGTIEIGGDSDFFRVAVQAGLTYTFKVNDFNIADAVLGLYDAGGALITQTSGAHPGGTHAQVVWTAAADGDVFLGVSAQPATIGDYIVLIGSTTQLPGDLNGDGYVGLGDLDIVLGHWNASVTPGDLLAGDPSGDGYVGLTDLDTVLGHWNTGTPPASQVSAEQVEDAAPSAQPATADPVVETPMQPLRTTQSAQQQQQTQRRQRVGHQPQAKQSPKVRTQRQAYVPAMAHLQTPSRSAFDVSAHPAYPPAFGLWETDDSE